MKISEILTEVFNNQPYPLKLEPDPSRYEQHQSAVTDDGRPINIYTEFNWRRAPEDQYLGVVFDVDREHQVTGKGDALRILNTVLTAIIADVNQIKPPYIALSADPLHYDIYRALAKRFGGQYRLLPLDQIPDMFKNQLTHEDPNSLFILKRKDVA